jgi:hypothetical protein
MNKKSSVYGKNKIGWYHHYLCSDYYDIKNGLD